MNDFAVVRSGLKEVPPHDHDHLAWEALERIEKQADLDAERAAILSSVVGRARLILGDASKETTALIDSALASFPSKKR